MPMNSCLERSSAATRTRWGAHHDFGAARHLHDVTTWKIAARERSAIRQRVPTYLTRSAPHGLADR